MSVLIITLIIFFLGLYFISTKNKIVEQFDNKRKPQYSCPNILIKHDDKYYLHNSNLAKIPGVNPLVFDNLEDYVEFTDWQRSQGIRCPILYLQPASDTQGQPIYKVRPGVTNYQPGLPDAPLRTRPAEKSPLIDAGTSNPPYNQKEYPGYDPMNQYIGLETPLDKIYHVSNNRVSPNPMDTTWGGKQYTEELVDRGYYKGDEVSLKV